jgi:hypothetical protein
MSVAASSSSVGSKRPALGATEDLESFFDILGLPNGAGKQVAGRSAVSGEPPRKRPKRAKEETQVVSQKKTAR